MIKTAGKDRLVGIAVVAVAEAHVNTPNNTTTVNTATADANNTITTTSTAITTANTSDITTLIGV